MSTEVDKYRWERRHALLYRVELSVLYHRKRERLFDTVDRTAKVLALVAASAALTRLTGDGRGYMGAAALVAATSAVSLVFSLSERARRHAELAKSFAELGADLTGKGELRFTDDDLDRMDAKIRLLEAAEPATLGALVQLCQNQIATAQNQPDLVVPISWLRRMFAHIWDFDGVAGRPAATKPSSRG